MTPLTFALDVATCIGLGWLGYGLMELAGVLVVRMGRGKR